MECNGCEFHPELYYDREYQIWVRREDDGSLTVGMTDLSQTIAGNIIHVRVRRPGTRRPPGKPVATIESGKWAGPVPNFFDCVIEEGNQEVLDNPVLLNQDPYNAWIARVSPSKGADAALEGFLTGDDAHRGYCERAKQEDIHCERLG
ncbi:MAG: glycine cleavage system protein H [Gammaproteobacteria bacterium]|nr:glycine cleavage system protein H [Gammaproteobacteria bacterium]NIR85507.1 glycine cleavage system protein H [Gammaproteobacteria bacterium]NIU06644.1 glycine cleavage system protein H [Gammaproteobacteria bacterium]NIX87917.1 glycine cleavage system protein H [Gammaproteobacteria bacterium]